MTADDRNAVELIKEAWGAYEYDEGTGWDLVSRLATALEDAVMRIAELEAERDAEVAAKAYERAILDVGLNPDLANQLLDTNPYRKAVQS